MMRLIEISRLSEGYHAITLRHEPGVLCRWLGIHPVTSRYIGRYNSWKNIDTEREPPRSVRKYLTSCHAHHAT